ncbi:MAG: HD domain-containing protein [Nannocystaceae bacterium]|nr:bifunctional (p)ppGpp synthetase/guanosine-3',5'-bis(diphosphate) 3'-pyrophosphohydrolase [Myxococcales bacterium]
MDLTLKHALDRAADWHRAQRRKYPNADVPYMSHCAGVAITLARHGFADDVVAAGALHDVLEDTSTTYEELAAEFGARIAELVRLVSEEDKSLPWEERKRQYLARFPTKPWEAQAITLADKLDNFRSILVCAARHGDPWPMFKRGREAQLARFDALAACLPALPPHPLIDEYREVLERVRAR